MPFAAQIISNIAEALHMSVTDINIKAKTNEGMGFVGRGEGVAVLAVATLKREKLWINPG